MDTLFIANPSPERALYNTAAQLIAHAGVKRKTIHAEQAGSIVSYNFNQMWVAALNMRKTHDVTHLLMWHADIRPLGQDWLDTMFDELESNDADVLSAIVPIKDDRGLTSTAFDLGDWKAVRLTQKQVWNSNLPDTWTASNLLINTGLMLVDMRKSWVEQVYFTINDKIVCENGIWQAYCESEDWNFSKQCHKLGVRLCATRKIITEHIGHKAYRSDSIWGQEFDRQSGVKEQHFETQEVI